MDAFTPPAERTSGTLHELGLSSRSGDLIDAVKVGLPIRVFRALAEALSVSEVTLASVTGISGTTLTRRKRSGHLTPDESEHVLRIATLLNQARQVFEDAGDAAEWLKTPNLSLGHKAPLEYADTEIGAREVENLLGRIDYGVYS